MNRLHRPGQVNDRLLLINEHGLVDYYIARRYYNELRTHNSKRDSLDIVKRCIQAERQIAEARLIKMGRRPMPQAASEYVSLELSTDGRIDKWRAE